MNESSEFEGWARACTPRLLRLATLLTGSADEGSDIVQDVLLALFRDRDRLGGIRDLDAYAARMVVNRHLSGRRSLTRRLRREHLVAAPEATGARIDQTIADRDELSAALATLGPRQRAVVLLRHVDGVSDDDIAATLRCSVATVRSQASRALAHLRAALTEGSRT